MMNCPNCKKRMEQDLSFHSITCDPGWKTRKGLKFDCSDHVYKTTLYIHVENKYIKALLSLNINWIDKLLLIFLDYEFTNSCVLERRFKRG